MNTGLLRAAIATASVVAPWALMGAADDPSLPDYTDKDRAEIAKRAERTWKRIDPEVKESVREFFRFALDATVAGWHPERVERVFELARTAQDKDPKSKTFGNFIWNWSDKTVMDRNSVEFCMQKGSLLWMFYRKKLSDKARKQLGELIDLSVEGIRRHAVKPGYTNIFLMKIWNCIALGENTGRPDLAEEGYAMLDEWLAYTAKNGVREYISPTYTGTDLESLSLLVKFSRKEDVRKKAETALRFLWTDIAANWFIPAERLGGAHSRDYDYLTGHGLLDRWVRNAGWPEPDGGERGLDPSVFDELSRWCPPRDVLEKAGGVVPRFVWQHWGEHPEEWAAQYIGKSFSLGAAGSCYWNMDKMLTVNWAGGATIPTTQLFWDGRGDPYGKNKIGESGAHSKALHLKPYTAAVQRGAEVLHFSMLDTGWKNIGHTRDEVKQLAVHWILPTEAGIWIGDETRKWPEAGKEADLGDDPVVFIRFKDAVVGLRILWTQAAKDASPRFVLAADGEKYGAGRFTCLLSGKKAEGTAGIACFVRGAEGLDGKGFEAFRKAFVTLETAVSLDDELLTVRASAANGPMLLKVDLAKAAVLQATGGEPGVEGGLLRINGRDVGREIMGAP